MVVCRPNQQDRPTYLLQNQSPVQAHVGPRIAVDADHRQFVGQRTVILKQGLRLGKIIELQLI